MLGSSSFTAKLVCKEQGIIIYVSVILSIFEGFNSKCFKILFTKQVFNDQELAVDQHARVRHSTAKLNIAWHQISEHLKILIANNDTIAFMVSMI